MTLDPSLLAWPAGELGQAFPYLARSLGLAGYADEARVAGVPRSQGNGQRLALSIPLMAARFGLEAEEVSAGLIDYEGLVQRGAPAILRLPSQGEFLLLLGARGKVVKLLGRDGTPRKVDANAVIRSLSAGIEEFYGDAIDSILEGVEGKLRRTAAVRGAILRELATSDRTPAGWLVRLHPGAGFWTQVRQRGGLHFLWTSMVAYGLYYSLWVLSWWLIGRGALAGRIELGWLLAWALLLATLVPLRALVVYSQGLFSVAAGSVLRRRLLDGALKLIPDEVRHQGVGQLLGRVIESEAVESMALAGGLAVLTAGLEILIACLVLVAGAAPGLHILTLAALMAVVSLLAFGYYRRRLGWTSSRLGITHDLVERLTGHRTVVIQQAVELRHHEEDRALEEYLERSRVMDRARVWLAAIPRGWLLLGFVALVPSLIGGGASQGRLAVSLGGVLLVYRAFVGLVGGMAQLTSAWISRQRVSDILSASATRPASPSAVAAWSGTSFQVATPILTARGLSYRFPNRSEVAVEPCDLEIQQGDRLLIEGPSGGGKSTLASLLAGLRAPTSGTLLLNGLDHRSIGGEVWRSKVIAAPQFHENHLVSETFAFNLLMGRRWPPEGSDLRDAERVCRELGLGQLIDKMPGGMLQRVGEAGWKLSHGERSRLFIARALLQDPEVLIIDEAFGALDPESLRLALGCVLERAHSLVVIAHP